MPRKNNNSTWLGYIENLTSKDMDPIHVHYDETHPIFQLSQPFQHMFPFIVPAMYLLDYTTCKYLLMSKTAKTISGYDADNFIKEGLGFTLDIYHKEDLRLFNEEVFPDRLSILKDIPAAEHHKYMFSYNYRTRNKKGEYVNLVQRNCFIKSDAAGKPLLSLGIITNVDHFKTENPLIHVVEKLDETSGLAEIVHKKNYYLNGEDRLFSKREKEVLLLCADGLTSKAIAEKLHIAENTVVNHRRNMQAKSGAANMAELIKFAIRNHII